MRLYKVAIKPISFVFRHLAEELYNFSWIEKKNKKMVIYEKLSFLVEVNYWIWSLSVTIFLLQVSKQLQIRVMRCELWKKLQRNVRIA